MRLVEKVAIVTGGAGGIGAATVRACASEGAHVVIADISQAPGEELAEQVRSLDQSCAALSLDVTDENSWSEAIEQVIDQFGAMHVLVNCAGIISPADVEEENIPEFERIMGVNAVGTWLGIKFCAPRMRMAGGGSIVNVASVAGVVGGLGRGIAYHASKGAVRGITRNAAIRYATDGIRVNSVHPGQVATPMQAANAGFEDANLASTPLGRYARPEEIASVIAFIAGDGASFMTGSEIFVDGGWTAA